jgi:predicted CoA-substrate-specific enzyme activase
MKSVIGIDMGSAYSDGIIMAGGEVLGAYECPSGGDYQGTAEKIEKELITQAGVHSDQIAYAVATGYGSKRVRFADEQVTDVSCHAHGLFSRHPSVRTAVDIGDLYSKAFHIDEKGNMTSFLTSGKCAGGSGRILKIIAKVLQLKVEEMGKIAPASKTPVEFGTGCAVFAESEAISRISEDVSKEDLLAGIYRALAAQVHSLAERLGIESDYAITGGGARNVGLIEAMREISGLDPIVPKDPHMTAALGAAIFAGERLGNGVMVS